MNWKDPKIERPFHTGYYLTLISIKRANTYFTHMEYCVEYFDGKSFSLSPLEYLNGELVDSKRLLWWCEISPPPLKLDGMQLGRPDAEGIS